MKIVAVTSILDEQAIIGHTVTHLLREGVDHIVVSVGGGFDTETRHILNIPGVTYEDQYGPFDQGKEITRLAYVARNAYHADWIIPFDADEFWIDPLGGTIREVLEQLPAECLKVHCAVFKHASPKLKYTVQNPLGKVAFRPSDEMTVAWGNHDVHLDRAGDEEHGLLEIRELQYRDYDHFVAKIDKARRLFDSWDVPEQHGHHMRQLVASEDLAAAWEQQREGEVVVDPIPGWEP